MVEHGIGRCILAALNTALHFLVMGKDPMDHLSVVDIDIMKTIWSLALHLYQPENLLAEQRSLP